MPTKRRAKRPARQRAETAKPRAKAPEKLPTELALRSEIAPATIPSVTLTLVQETFALAWLANGFNASAAYRASHPAASVPTSSVEGCRLLAHPKVRAYLEPLIKEQLDARKIDAEEALANLGDYTRADVALLYDEKDVLRPVREWPESIKKCVRSIKDGPYGKTITLEPRFQSNALVLQIAGKVKGVGDSFDALAEAIRADKARNAHIPLPADLQKG